jgi:hypothetical protein
VKERILAVLGAVALVALAVLVRGRLIHDGGNGNGPTKAASERPVVACTPDLTRICEALAASGTIAEDPPALDLDRAAAPPDKIDGWITWSPAPDIAELDVRGDAVWGRAVVLGSAELGVLAVPGTLGCPGPVAWSCLAEKATTGTTVGVGLVTTAEGLARLAPLQPSLARGGDPTDVDAELGRAILDAPSGQDDAASMVNRAITQPGALDAVVAPLPAATSAAATPQAEGRKLQALQAVPTQRVAVVLATRTRSGASRTKLDPSGVVKATRRAVPADLLTGLGLSPGGEGPSIDAGALWQLRKNLR